LDDIPPEEVDAARLGDRSDVDVTLFHIQVSPGDAVLLIETDVARALPADAWGLVLAKGRGGGSQAVLDALLEAARDYDLVALAVTIGDGGAGQQAEPVAPDRAGAVKGPPVGEQLLQWAGGLRLGDRLRSAGRAVAAALAGLWIALRTLVRRMMPSRVPDSRATRPGQARPVGAYAARAGEREKAPRGRSRSGARTLGQGEILHKILIGAAVAIPLIVAVVVAVTLVQRGQTRRVELDELWQQATKNWQQANTVTDRAAQRTYLAAAQSSLDRFLQRQPDRADALDLKKKVVERLDQVNQVKRVGWVGELNGYSGDVDLSRVVVQGMHVFVMDRRSGQVYHHQLDTTQQSLRPDSKVVVKRGEQVDGVLVNDLVDMVWMGIDAGNVRQRAALVVLESGGALIEYDPTTGERRALAVAARDVENYAKLVGSHTGRLYVLDPKTNKIWRYDATPDGYSGAPYEWLQTSLDLAGVVDMAIGDGIYLLYADGRISKLMQGQPADFSTADWDASPRDPTALSAYPPDETEWLYIADRGNSRIVQSAVDGKFTRQFRLSDAQLAAKGDVLKKVTSLFVDESVKRAYFLSGNKLYVISLSE